MPTKMVRIRPLSASVDANTDDREPFPSKECSEFDRSMHLSVTGLRLWGIPLDPAGIHSLLFRNWSIIFGWIAFLGNLGGNLAILTDLVSRQLHSTRTTTTSWNLLINKFNFVFFFITNHAAFFFCTAPNWSKIRSILGRIENLGLFDSEDHRKFRRIFNIGNITILVLMMTTWPLGLILSLYSAQQAIHPIYFGFAMYVVTNLCFFYFFCWVISKMIHILRLSKPVDLHRWRAFFDLMTDLIEQSNKCFGPTILCTFVFLSIWFVNGSFYIMVNIREYGLDRNVLPFFMVEVFALFLFFLMIYACHRIHQEGLHFASRLRKYNPEEKDSRQLAQYMVLEVLTSPLQLTAWGLFDINFHLLPSLAGSSLTYIIILFQFRTTEE